MSDSDDKSIILHQRGFLLTNSSSRKSRSSARRSRKRWIQGTLVMASSHSVLAHTCSLTTTMINALDVNCQSRPGLNLPSPWRYRQAHPHARKYLKNNMRSVLEQGRLLSLILNLIFGAYCPRPDFEDFFASWPPSWCVWLGTGGSSCPRQPLYWPVASS